MDGQGKFYWSNGKTYVGEFRNDSRNGYGICRYSDRSRYEGNWKDNQKEGEGKLFNKGIVKVGIWKRGELIQVLEKYNEVEDSDTDSDITSNSYIKNRDHHKNKH